jgi:hypothetical protein
LRDAAIAAFGAVLALNLVFPGNVDQAKSEAPLPADAPPIALADLPVESLGNLAPDPILTQDVPVSDTPAEVAPVVEAPVEPVAVESPAVEVVPEAAPEGNV